MFAALSLLAVGLLALSPSAYLPPVMQTAPAAVDTIETLTIPSFDAYPLEGRRYCRPINHQVLWSSMSTAPAPIPTRTPANFQPIRHSPTLIWSQAASTKSALPFSVTVPAA